ncbi:MAG: tetratricopeptide repeat protein, partial [Candidatus Heimdallarchaeota archaeon]|nr:tetratricopeptide repeat protein [Candidatus Heimdallarchaeota archaeon]
ESLLSEGKFEEAINKFETSISINSEYFAPYLNWGSALLQMGNLNEALIKLQQSIAYNPKEPTAYVIIGIIYDRLGTFDKAVASYLQTIQIDPKFPSVYHNLGISYDHLGEKEKAMEYYEKSISINPTYECYRSWGICLNSLGRYKEAREKYKLAIDIDSNNDAAIINYGTSLMDENLLFESCNYFLDLLINRISMSNDSFALSYTSAYHYIISNINEVDSEIKNKIKLIYDKLKSYESVYSDDYTHKFKELTTNLYNIFFNS